MQIIEKFRSSFTAEVFNIWTCAVVVVKEVRAQVLPPISAEQVHIGAVVQVVLNVISTTPSADLLTVHAGLADWEVTVAVPLFAILALSICSCPALVLVTLPMRSGEGRFPVFGVMFQLFRAGLAASKVVVAALLAKYWTLNVTDPAAVTL